MAFLPVIAAVAGGIGAGVSAYGAVEQGQAQSDAANYQAQVAKNNAIVADQNATYATAAGEAQASATSLKGAATSGRIKTAQAANGVDVNTGSAVDVQQSAREQEKLDTETVLNNAQLQAYGYRTQATGFTAQAGLDTGEAAQAPIGADIGAAGGLLSSASSLGFKWGGTGTGLGGSSSSPTYAAGPNAQGFAIGGA